VPSLEPSTNSSYLKGASVRVYSQTRLQALFTVKTVAEVVIRGADTALLQSLVGGTGGTCRDEEELSQPNVPSLGASPHAQLLDLLNKTQMCHR
jgi:hypothetical protein